MEVDALCDKNGLRLVTFNVNGVRTLFQHYPFSRMNNSLKEAFELFKADIITFQELKIDASSIQKWGRIDGYQSYISIPRKKKGYSGVGCWVRQPTTENDPLRKHLQVIKAEEGITGLLSTHNKALSYRNSPDGIGGYTGLDVLDEEQLIDIDSEGRCVLIELACNIVVISTYCPANSTQTEEGERSRLLFLNILFKRIRNLYELGKQVVLMGDINVCRDLIDQAVGLDESNISVSEYKTGSQIEETIKDKCIEFIMEPTRVGRRLLNSMLCDSIIPQYAEKGILVDTTREIQGRDRTKMYTVWNTLLNTRPINYGSRIDFVFVTKDLRERIVNGNILNTVMGSDHCPVFADLKIDNMDINEAPVIKPKFEASSRYSLNQKNIMDMFRKVSSAQENVTKTAKTTKISKPALLGSKGLGEKFIKRSPTISQPKLQTRSAHIKAFEDMLGKPPKCQHGEETILRTSKTDKTFGRKFWVCKRSKGESNDPEGSCGFFQWK